MKTKWSSLGFILIALFPGCGIDVGNAGKPLEALDFNQVAELVGLEHEEAINAALDGSDYEDTAAALRLTAQSSCVADGSDGSVTLVRENEKETSKEFGRKAKAKVLNDTLSYKYTLKLQSSAGAISCNGDRPSLSRAQLVTLATQSTYARNRSRTIQVQSSGEVLSEASLVAEGQRKKAIKLVSFSADELVLEKTSEFSSQLVRKKMNATDSLSSSMKTLPQQALVVRHTRNRQTGALGVTIVSGAVAASDPTGRTLVLHYDGVNLQAGASCQPTSGSIRGEILQSDVLEASFTLVFSADGALIRFEDGTEQDVETEVCTL